MTQLLPNNGYRDWYYALMDYGSHLKVHVGNKSRQAKIYTKQVPFKGSIRQTRGLVLRALGTAPQSLVELSAGIGDERLSHICEQLISEGIIHEHKQYYFLG